MSRALTGDPELARAREEVKAILSEEVGRAGNIQSPDFLAFMLGASTQEIRGLGCSHAERAQLAAWLAPLNEHKARACTHTASSRARMYAMTPPRHSPWSLCGGCLRDFFRMQGQLCQCFLKADASSFRCRILSQ